MCARFCSAIFAGAPERRVSLHYITFIAAAAIQLHTAAGISVTGRTSVAYNGDNVAPLSLSGSGYTEPLLQLVLYRCSGRNLLRAFPEAGTNNTGTTVFYYQLVLLLFSIPGITSTAVATLNQSVIYSVEICDGIANY